MEWIAQRRFEMTFARFLWLLVFSAALAACSGNLGGGQSTLPGMPQTGTNGTQQQLAPAPATPTPNSASNVATVGDTLAPQALPGINGWGGSIAFSKPAASPAASPNSKSTATPVPATPGGAVSVGITASVVEPTDAPHFGTASAKRRDKHDPNAITPLFFISLLATSDLTLDEYPKISVNVPRDVASAHRDDLFALALYDPEQKEKAYRLAVAERDLSSPLPGSAPTPVVTAVPTPAPAPTPFGMPNGAVSFTPPPIGPQLSGESLPPEYVAFTATQTPLKLKANRPVVFAFYTVPPPPSPSPSASPAPAVSASPSAASSTASPSSSALPTASTKPADLR
jgi:hypothetical protein